MDELFSRQNAIIIEVEKIYNNFRKDSASRKTKDYIQRRLQSLDNLWGEFQQNDSHLEQYKDEKLEYFAKKVFSEFKNYFEITRANISSHIPPSASSEMTFSVPVINTGSADIKPGNPLEDLLSKQRTNFRALQRLIENIDVDKISEKWEIEDELKILQHRWNNIDELHLQIDNMLQGGDGFYDGEFQRIEKSYKDMKRTLNRKNFSTAHAQKAIPTIEIPIFTGKYEQWPTFCDLFSETIHTNNCLSNTQKMQHLKSKLKGEAERLIQHLNISADNYDTAWELLQHRYNNPQVLFTKQIETFLSQPTLHKQTSFDLKKMYDTTMECIHAIHNLGVDTRTWDPLLVHLVVKKLDLQTYTDYKESRKAPRDLPSFDELMSFIESKFIALEPIHKRERENPPIRSVQPPSSSFKPPYFKTSKQQTFRNYQAVTSFTRKCPYCSLEHDLFMCKKFQNMTPEIKLQTINKLQVCHNCLYRHLNNKCNSFKRCKECNAAHNTLLHDIMTTVSPTPKASTSSVHELSNQLTRSINHVANHDEEILLTTLMLRVRASDNTFMTFRALLDQGSQVSLISENAVQRLGLKRRRCHVSVTGIGVGSKQGKGVVSLDCRSIHNDNNYTLQTDALVIRDVVNRLPNTTFGKQDWPHLQHLNLADPEYNVSKPIDILLDASVYSDIIQNGLRKGPSTAPIAQQTRLGWILSGNVKTFQCNIALKILPDLSKYWEIEDIANDTVLSNEDIYCEELFQKTTKRREDGSYEVALPMIPDFHQKLGTSKPKAIAQFLQIEKKMNKDKQLSDGYHQFMREYQDLNHMCEVKPEQTATTCYLPHHGVLKPDSSTTSLRVVFNASSKTSSGLSLNDLMYSGPNLQQDLLTLIHKWRQHQYVVTADIEKMFRQIHIRDSDQSLQRILWRDSSHALLKEYQLTTVTYGMKAAPFLAMRVLKQIGRDNATSYPLAASTLEQSFYMDDLMTSHYCKTTLRALQEELITVLKSAGMNIRKWSSNEPDLLNNLPTEQRDITHYDFKDSETRKTLGLRWNVTSDSFTFKNKLTNDKILYTKRAMLSEISQTFDPLGWLSPLTIRAKLLFQKTWDSDISWDTELPHDIQKEWSTLRKDLQNIENYIIPRFIGDMRQKYQIHGFCDASERAYACAVYIVTEKHKGEFTSTLVAAKTKVAPRNKQVTLPRLELLGALLLSQLIKKLIATLPKDNMQMYAWTDSMIVLGWLHGERIRWKQFVANRVQQITDIIPATSWRHVRSEENAADCATRGLSSDILQNQELWWKGPEWLTKINIQNLTTQTYEIPTIEVKRSNVHAALLENNLSFVNELLFTKSNISDIIKTICWYSRFIAWLRNKQSVTRGSLTPSEKENAYNLVIKTVQAQDFSSELSSIRVKGYVHKKSKIISLNPFIDEQGILRVGGRLRNSTMAFSTKHPIILSPGSRFTKLLIYMAHLAVLHGGPKLTLTYLREKYWVINGIRTVKKQLSECVKCRRYHNIRQQPIMADLPEVRITPSRAFSNVGVDFTGHVEIKTNKGRGVKTTKGYVAVFVCMSTKAVHLELVSDMSTATFLAAFKRMCARRGSPANVYSDNGTNFVGAAKALRREYKDILDIINASFDYGTKDMDIRWHFNAPAWPNAGGLWEAAVKSFKHHLKRVLGEQRLTYEEFTTLLYQIEACLNSRPLCQLTEDPDDTYLTPGHFLIGGSLISRPQADPDIINLPTRWQLIQALNKGFWKAWSKDYLQQLQNRTKWRVPCKNLQVGDVVLVKEDNTPPGKWALGRIQELYPGQDGHVRVVTLKVQNNNIKRPVNKLVLLPVNEQTDTNTCCKTKKQEDKDKKVDKPITRQRRHFNVCSIFTTLLYLLTFFTMTYSLEITNMNSNQGLYFDRIANMQLIRSEWKIITYYDMEPYWEGISAYRRYSEYLETGCTALKQQTACDVILVQLRHAFSELEYYNTILKRQNVLTRQKRGLIDGVGNIANSLFGVLDNKFAEKYETDISLLKDNQHHLLNLWKNQTSVIEAEYNLLKRTESSIQQQHKLFNRHVNEMEDKINKVKTDIDHVKYMDQFILSIMSANVMYTYLKNVQDTLIDTVTNIYNGKFNIHLLTPQQLQRELSIISSQLSKDLILPIDNTQSDIQSIYHLLKIKTRMTDKYMIFEIRLPLVSRDSYELYKTIPIPHQVQDKMISIVPVSTYIGMNLQKDSYLPITTEDIEHCLVHESDTYMCYLQKPIYHMRNDNDLCKTNSINKQECKTIKGTCQNKWMNLNKINTYFYFCCGDCYLRTLCAGAQVTRHRLARANIVSISENCIIKTDNFTVYGHSQFENNLNARDNIDKLVIPSINQVFNITMKPPQIDIYNSTDLFYSNETNAALEALRDQISKLKSSEHLSDGISYHDVHHYAITYILVGGLAVTGMILVCRHVRRRRQHATLPTLPLSAAPGPLPPAPVPRARSLSALPGPTHDDIALYAEPGPVTFKIPVANDSTPQDN